LWWNGSGRYSSTHNYTEFVHFAEECGRLEAFFRKRFFVVVLGVVFTWKWWMSHSKIVMMDVYKITKFRDA
jgi:hypothetical protein